VISSYPFFRELAWQSCTRYRSGTATSIMLKVLDRDAADLFGNNWHWSPWGVRSSAVVINCGLPLFNYNSSNLPKCDPAREPGAISAPIAVLLGLKRWFRTVLRQSSVSFLAIWTNSLVFWILENVFSTSIYKIDVKRVKFAKSELSSLIDWSSCLHLP